MPYRVPTVPSYLAIRTQSNSVCTDDFVSIARSLCGVVFSLQACPVGQVPNSGQTACENCTAGNYRGASDSACVTCPTGEVFMLVHWHWNDADDDEGDGNDHDDDHCHNHFHVEVCLWLAFYAPTLPKLSPSGMMTMVMMVMVMTMTMIIMIISIDHKRRRRRMIISVTVIILLNLVCYWGFYALTQLQLCQSGMMVMMMVVMVKSWNCLLI